MILARRKPASPSPLDNRSLAISAPRPSCQPPASKPQSLRYGTAAACATRTFLPYSGTSQSIALCKAAVAAAKKYGVKAVGIEIDGELVDKARSRAQSEGVAELAEFREQDAFDADISQATVVTIYMLPEFNYKLRPKLEALKPGARVVCHDFGVEGWTPDRVEKSPDNTLLHTHTIYLYKR